MKYCSECGNEVGANDIFCSNCGLKVTSKSNGNIDKDKSIKADLKIEVTNATTEKAFKKVGEAVEGGKEVVKTTTGIVKKIFIPVAVLLVIAGVTATIYEQNQKEKRAVAWEQTINKIDEKKMIEERNCVIQEYKKKKSLHKSVGASSKTASEDAWDGLRYSCDLTYTEVENYKNEFGVNLEKL